MTRMREQNGQTHPDYRHDLGGGLVTRWSTAADTEDVAYLLGMTHRDSAEAPINARSQARARLLMRGDAPVMGPGDFAVVEDSGRADHRIIACACLWRHTWEFGGIPMAVGRPEYVATDPAYRRRGLIRELFALLHARSAAEGHHLQAITGISNFYRQFGYEYALDLEGKRVVHLSQVPNAPEGAEDAYLLRKAVVDDIPTLQELHAQRQADALLWSVEPAEHWRYQIVELAELGSPDKAGGLMMITDRGGIVVGYLHVALRRWSARLGVYAFVTQPEVNLRALLPPVLRALARHGQAIPVTEQTEPLRAIDFQLGREHPVYAALGPELAPYYEPPYAWYIRVPDVAGFLRRVAPVLEGRLAASVMAGYTGELLLDHYRGGLRLVFAAGALATVEPWRPPEYGDAANAGCPPLVFLQLLFGYRTLAELRHAFPDVWANDEARLLLEVIFPKQLSYVLD